MEKWHFPDIWKITVVALIPKVDKDLRLKENYRPICLLPVWGKVMDKIINNRLMKFLESNKILELGQYGFRRNLGTINALEVVKSYIDLNMRDNKLICMLSFDSENAFNSIHRNSILKILDKYNVPNRLKNIIADYLNNRKFLLSGNEYLEYNVGVPQGSSLGPTLWLLIANELLNKAKNENYKIIMYADDIVVLLNANASFHFSELAKIPIMDIVNWCEEHRLQLSLDKCCFTVFKKGKNISHIPRIKIGNVYMKYTRVLKYLGLNFDVNLTWTLHINILKDKINSINYKMRQVVRATWGLNPNIIKNIYKLVIKKMILYGAKIWYRPMLKLKIKFHNNRDFLF